MTNEKDTHTLLPLCMDDDDRRDLLLGMATTLQYALMNDRYLANIDDKQIYEYMEMAKRLV